MELDFDMSRRYNECIENFRKHFEKDEFDSFYLLKSVLKESVRQKVILSKCSEILGVILELTDSILELFQLEYDSNGILRLLSELSILLGLLRNVSTVSIENRQKISSSKLFRNLNNFIYIRLNTEEKIGLLNTVSFKMLKVLCRSSLEEACYNDLQLRECLLLTCRFLHLLANISIDCDIEYKNYLFKTMYPFGFINIYLVELIFLAFGLSQGSKVETSAVACSFHLIYNLIKSRTNTMGEIIEKRELFECFIFVSVSMYLNSLKHTGTEQLKSSEWIFFFFKSVLYENPQIFYNLYFYNHSEESKYDCDASLIYLTMQEPFVKLSMLENSIMDISDAKITKEILLLQKHISDTILTEYEFKDIVLEICTEIEANPNFKHEPDEPKENIISKIFTIDNMLLSILLELKNGTSYLDQFVKLQIGGSSELAYMSQEGFSVTKLGNIRGWISIFRISTPKDESNLDFFDEVLINLANILESMLKFRKCLVKSTNSRHEKMNSVWRQVSEEVSMTSVIQAISTICYGNIRLQNSFCKVQERVKMLMECTTIVDESHPFIREAAVFSIRSITENNTNVSEILSNLRENEIAKGVVK
ncbi:hypothetical protein OJ253_949 [Cryptosporidium canis]|uniref:Ataxin-10 domain-containing protein n=1 Tax=Cryptosporidium canis TaxID=195482 RepID=A0A9D5DHX0_9CRYT|nr:hypothetical protein OJ253_949 [Cryptosporidium canis]